MKLFEEMMMHNHKITEGKEKELKELFDFGSPNINLNLDASGQSVGFLGGTGGTVHNDDQEEAVDTEKDSIDPKKATKRSTEILNERSYEARHYTNGILELMDEGVIDGAWLAEGLLKWMGEDEVEDFARVYELKELIDGEEELDESAKKSIKEKFQKRLSEDLKLISDIGDYEPWSGAVEIWDKIVQEGKVDDLDFMLEDIYPDGMTMTQLNDLLWFDGETVLGWLGISDVIGEHTYRVTNIVWDADEDDDIDELPSSYNVDIEVEEEDDDIEELVRDALENEFGFSASSFDFELDESLKNKKGSKKLKESVDGYDDVYVIVNDGIIEDMYSTNGNLNVEIIDLDAAGYFGDDETEGSKLVQEISDRYHNGELKSVLFDYKFESLKNKKGSKRIKESVDEERPYLTVCDHCLAGIESHEGPQITKTIHVDDEEWFDSPEEYERESKCDWCDEYGFDTLYEIHGKGDMDFDESCHKDVTEDTVKKSNGKWTNRGDTGKEHGEFKTKKAADAQRKAMYARGYKGESKKKVTESTNSNLVNKVAKFIEEAVDDLVPNNLGCHTYKLDDRLAVCVGWANRADEDLENVVHLEDYPDWVLETALKVWTSDDLRDDIDYINSPYFEDGMVWDTETLISPMEDYQWIAQWFVEEYEKLKKYEIEKDGKIIGNNVNYEDELDESKKKVTERNLTRSERHNRNMDRIFNTEKEQDKKFADFLRKKGYSEDEIKSLADADKLNAEIHSKFGGSKAVGDALRESADTVAKILSKEIAQPKDFKFLSNNGETGEVSHKGAKYAFRKLKDGSYKVMPSEKAGWNWSETLFKDESLKESYLIDIALDEIVKDIRNDYTSGLLGDGTSWALNFGDDTPDEADIEEIVNAIKEDHTSGITGNGVTWDLDMDFLEDKYNQDEYDDWYDDSDFCYEYKGYTICSDYDRGLWTIKELKDETFSTDTDAEDRIDSILDESLLKEKSYVKLGTDVGEYQEWVDYDMKRYGRVSVETRRKLRNAGLTVVKDKYGDYEVISHDPVDYRKDRRDKFSKRSYKDDDLDESVDEEPQDKKSVGLTHI